MRRRGLVSRLALAASAVAAAAIIAGGSVGAQERPKDLTVMPPVPTTYTPPKTAWGDWDFRATYQIEFLNNARILFQRPSGYGNRFWLTDEEFQKRLEAAKKSDANFSAEGKGVNASGTQGLAKWIETSPFAKRTSMLISPADGNLPNLTPWAEKMWKEGRSSWVPGLEYDWVDDFDSWDACVSRGFPASMFPFRYNNGIRIWQSPGYIVIQHEMIATRVIPILKPGQTLAHWPRPVEAWMGNGVAHWEGKTLVIETTNIKSGDAVSHDVTKRAASPLNMASQNVPPFNTIPTSTEAKTVERLTMTGPTAMTYEITYSDPKVFTAPWTARLEWIRDDSYFMPEYACHEGDVQIRNYIKASRAHREALAAGTAQPDKNDSRSRFAVQFDFDPAAPKGPVTPPIPNMRGQQ